MNMFPNQSVHTMQSFVKWFRITEKDQELNLLLLSSNAQILLFKETALIDSLSEPIAALRYSGTIPTMGGNPSQAPGEYEINSQE